MLTEFCLEVRLFRWFLLCAAWFATILAPGCGGTTSDTKSSTGVGGMFGHDLLPDAGDAGTASCDELQQAARSALNEFLLTRRGCSTNADCIQNNAASAWCIAPCGYLVNRAAAPDVESYAVQLCAPFLSRGCQVPQLECVDCSGGPVCDDFAGTCSSGCGL